MEDAVALHSRRRQGEAAGVYSTSVVNYHLKALMDDCA